MNLFFRLKKYCKFKTIARKHKNFSTNDIVYSQRKLLVINKIVYDVTNFIHKHPGGEHCISKICNQEEKVEASISYHFHSKESKEYVFKKFIVGITA